MSINQKIKHYTDLINQNKEVFQSLIERGNCYLALNDYKNAKIDYERSISVSPDNYMGYFCMGELYFDIGKYSKAIKSLNYAIDLNNKDAKILNKRGCSYGKLRIENLALLDFEKAIEMEPDNSVYYYNRGVSLFRFKKYEAAALDFKKSAEIYPLYPNNYFYLSSIAEFDQSYFQMEKLDNSFLYTSSFHGVIWKSNHLFKKWGRQPYNYIFLMDNFEIKLDYCSTIFFPQISKLQDIELYKLFLITITKSESKKKKIEGILNFYMGSVVSSSISLEIFLNLNNNNKISAQDLYYINTSIYQRGIYSQEIDISLIGYYEKYVAKNLEDNYYLGQFCLTRQLIDKAIGHFYSSIDYIPSLIMLISIEENSEKRKNLFAQLMKNNINDLLPFFLIGEKTEILVIEDYESQFKNYFLYQELLSSTQFILENFELNDNFYESNFLEFWDKFYLSKSARENIQLKLRELEINSLIEKISNELQKSIEEIDEIDKQIHLNKLAECSLPFFRTPLNSIKYLN